MTQQELETTIEKLIDEKSVSEVLAAIATVCFEKAQHVRESYLDKVLAEQWEANGSKVARIILTDSSF
jgi:hypothetical protein